MVEIGLAGGLVAEHQADAHLAQATPVQNTWYVVLDTTRQVRAYSLQIDVATVNETLEARLTIDGNTRTGSQAAVAGTAYFLYLNAWGGTVSWDTTAKTAIMMALGFMDCHSLKVEMRKTTATGAGTLDGRLMYGLLKTP